MALQPRPDPPAVFLVERYWPGVDLAQLRTALTRLDAAAAAMTDEGDPVAHFGSILMPDDEVVFSLIAAADASLVRRLDERADLPADRIAAAIPLLSGGATTPGPDLGGTAP